MKAAALEVSHRQARPDVVVVTLVGRIILGPTSASVQELLGALFQEGQRKIVVDMSGVTHIDSTGIGVFIAGLGKLSEAGGRLVIAGATGLVRDSFRVMRLDTVFGMHPDVESAVRTL